MGRLHRASTVRARTLRHASLLLLLSGAVVALAGPGGATGSATKLYSVQLAPTTAAAGSTATYVLTLRNATNSTHTLGSANVTVPTGSGFAVDTVGAAAAPPGKTWSTTLASGVIRFRAASSSSAIAPGQSVSTSLTVTTACNATGGTWTSAAKQANTFNGPPGNDFTRVGSDPVLSVTAGTGGGSLVSLEFAQQPMDSEKGSPIAPALTVRGVDACGNTATGASDTVSIGFGTNPSGATLGGTTSKSLVNGTATFADLTIDRSGVGYTLKASKGLVSVTSALFDVVDALCTSADAFCEAFDEQELTYVKTDGPPSGGTMALTCSGFGGTFTCGETARPVIGSQVTVDPMGYTKPIEATFSWDKSLTGGTGVANFVFCLSKDDGATFFVVPQCGKGVGPTCEVRRNRSGEGHLRIVVRLAPQDPIGSLG